MVLGTLGVLVLAALGASSRWGPMVTVIPGDPEPVATPPPPPSASPTPSPDVWQERPETEPLEIPTWLIELVIVLAVAAVAVLVVWLVVASYRALRAPGLPRAVEATGTAVEVPEIDQEEVSLSLEQTLARLRSGLAVDDAIVECWRRLETIAADSGIGRATTQTSEEFTVAILAHAVVDDAALTELAALYRRAVFSAHVLTEADRERAIRCVERLAAQMGARDAR